MNEEETPKHDTTAKHPYARPRGWSGANNKQRYLLGEKRRADILKLITEDNLTLSAAAERVGVSVGAVRLWRKDKDFSAKLDAAIHERDRKNEEQGDTPIRQGTKRIRSTWESDFGGFRHRYFKRDTPLYQRRIVSAYEDTKPGNILLVLIPPEHGKTTLFEDYVGMKLALDPNYRITVGTEAQNLGRRIISRVKNRMEPHGPYPMYVAKFGPFVPEAGDEMSTRQPWAADYFNVKKKGEHDERDYSMMAIGFGAAVAGTRTDHLHIDDIQSMRSLNMTEKMLTTFRQDWLTRPGERGRTTINGTRVGDGDFYEGLIEQFAGSDILEVIKMPAIVKDLDTGEELPLWPYDKNTKTGYTLDMLERIRKKVGEDAWSRNYMQAPRAVSFGTFTDQMIETCLNPMRSIYELPVKDGGPVFICVDPALGGKNCIMAIQATADKLYLIDILEDTGLRRNEEIMVRIETMVRKVQVMGGRVTDCIIETKNFQAGLGRDERLLKMSMEYKFQLREHLTNWNKYDENIGVSSMASDFLHGKVDLPYSPDNATQDMTNQFVDQCKRWRPFVKGAKLRQDQVMAFWFGWILWQMRRKTSAVDAESFRTSGVSWATTSHGLVVPTTGSPFYKGQRAG